MPNSERPLVVITGGNGLIGSRLVRALASTYRVVVIDNEPGTHGQTVGSIVCDLTDAAATAHAMDELRHRHGGEVASFIHLAAYYDFTGAPSPLYRTLTVDGTRRLLQGLQRFPRVEQFVFSSTVLVMEPVTEAGEVITETSVQEDEPWDYPRSKIEAEAVIRAEHRDIPAVLLRIAGAYDEEGHSVPIAQHIARIHEKQLESYLFPGDPTHGQPFVHLDDLVDAFRAVVEHRKILGPLEVFLIAEPEVLSYDELQDELGELIHGREWPTIRIPKVVAKAGAWVRQQFAGEEGTFIQPWMVDLADAHYPVAIDHARRVLHWQPRHRLHDALAPMVQALKRDPAAFYEINKLGAAPGTHHRS